MGPIIQSKKRSGTKHASRLLKPSRRWYASEYDVGRAIEHARDVTI
jgi:hypothetical protein